MIEAIHLFGVLLATLYPLAAFWAGGHALLNARDPGVAWGWIAVCILFPLAGALLYYLFGINRIRARARLLLNLEDEAANGTRDDTAALALPVSLQAFAHTADAVTRRPALPGNQIEMLHNGDAAYPEMLAAIDNAQHSIWLTTYIFRRDKIGRAFADALGAAVRRGVEVRVLIDGVGACYGFSFPTTMLRLRKVRAVRFLPPRLIPPMLHINLRNHRKLLVVDGSVAFTGGINIAAYHQLSDVRVRKPVADVHFRVRGPVVAQLAMTFAEDWRMAAREMLRLPPAPAPLEHGAVCRVITDGPDDDLDKLAFTLLGAVSVARKRVLIMTPYFLPSPELAAALKSAALRGVEVVVILPERSNLRFVDWATQNMLSPLLESGVKLVRQPPPFAHSKLFVVDDAYAQIGTANIDPRSLRLNFELAVEIYDATVAGRISAHMDAVHRRSEPVTLAALKARRLPARLRDAFFWLFSSYL
jgi:cardiolipin synthase